MLLRDLFENVVGKNDYHPESFYAPTVAKFIKDEGVALWPDIYAYVELIHGDDFTDADLTPVPSGKGPRWKVNVNNLHQHRTLEGGKFGDIVRIKGGFATGIEAMRQKIPVLADNNLQKRNPGTRNAQEIKRLMGVIVNTAWNELDKPKMSDVKKTRINIENMIKKEPWADEKELIKKAKQIIIDDNNR